MLRLLSRKRLRRLILGETLVSILPDAPLSQAAALMRDRHVGALAVVNADGHLRGILSERDLVHRCFAAGDCGPDAPVSKIMTRRVVTADQFTPIGTAITVMIRHDIRHLPVMQGHKVVGMVSMRRLVREFRDSAMRMEAVSLVPPLRPATAVHSAPQAEATPTLVPLPPILQ